MPSDLPRTHFNRSRLTCLLADLALVDADQPGAAIAERWGRWLGISDAIALSATLADKAAMQAKANSPLPAESLRSAYENLRYSLEQAIQASCVPNGSSRIRLPSLENSSYAAYQRFYQAHQRDMELAIAPLRTRARKVLASASPALEQLATLDQVLEEALSAREGRMLASVPPLLETHFVRMRQNASDPLNTDQQPDGWWVAFGQTLQAALLAELELRLQPVLGLIEAFEQAGLPAQESFQE